MVYGTRQMMNRSIRENGHKRNIFDKVHEIREHIKKVLPEVDGSRLIQMLSHCRQYYEGKLHYGRRGIPENQQKKRDLTEAERILFDLLLRLNLNPSTTYRWFLAARIPGDIKEKLAKGMISQKKALEIAANRKRVKESNTGLLMIEEIRTIMRSL
ncbi:hypothetical protein HY495_00205 [Candidatus Woesearchaeota archaeon]|nr:hypothetical protein [Candidatus Woesearchaeota archaeon]